MPDNAAPGLEKAPTDFRRARRRSYVDRTDGPPPAASLGLRYITPSEIAKLQSETGLLGIVGFGVPPPGLAIAACPTTCIDVPALDRDNVLEAWTSELPVVREESHGITAARNDELLFGCLQMEERDGLAIATRFAYCQLFDFIDELGYGHLVRAWNYFPRINADADNLERYQHFTAGRHAAFAARGRTPGPPPAASALGSRSGALTICFLAARKAGRAVDNPRQVNPNSYPARYGASSPVFSRAMLMPPHERVLCISGTASIVGYRTLHADDPVQQCEETVANLLSVIAKAQKTGADFRCPAAKNVFLKAYVRHASHLAPVRACLARAFGPRVNAVYLQADICRADLLLQVEATCLP